MMRGLVVSIAMIAGAGAAAAQPAATPPPAAPGAGPLFFRGHVGLDLQRIGFETDGGSNALVGRTLGFSLALGGKIAPRVRLYGEYFHRFAAELRREDEDGITSGTSADPSYRGVGAGVAYYWAGGAYLGVTVGIARIVWIYEGMDVPDDRETDFGPHAAIQVGQDWRSYGAWSVGVAAQAAIGAMEELRFDTVRHAYVPRTVSLQLAVTRH